MHLRGVLIKAQTSSCVRIPATLNGSLGESRDPENKQWVLVQGLGGRGVLGRVLKKEVASTVDGRA